MTKRSLAYLIEAEMDKHSILFAAKDITNKLQQIAEQLAKMVANEIMPLGDAARDVFGPDEASAFEKALSDKINGLTDQVRETKNAIADQIDSLESGQPASDLGSMDDSAGMFGGDTGADAGNDLGGAGDAEMFGGDDAAAPEGEGEEPAADLDLDDLFSGTGEESNAAGRLQKESATSKKKALNELSTDTVKRYADKAQDSRSDALQKKGSNGHIVARRPEEVDSKTLTKRSKGLDRARDRLKENALEASADYQLTREFAGLVREGYTVASVLDHLAESYAIDASTVAEIVTAVTASKKKKA